MTKKNKKVETNAAAKTKQTAIKFNIERIYLRDVSLECPQGVAAFGKGVTPQVELDMSSSHSAIAEDLYEVVLRLTVTVVDNDSSDNIYLVEVKQAGLFRVSGLGEDQLARAIATLAPSSLFPYAREAIDSLVVKANFPPLRLAPINFDALFLQALEKRKAAVN